MRGPGGSTWSDEVAAADEVEQLLADMQAAGIEIKLGHVPDDQRRKLTPEIVKVMVRRKTDILRVLLAKQLVEEAREIRHKWQTMSGRTSENGRRYGDLLFSARALLPPGYDWDHVTYTSHSGPVPWDHQLAFDAHGHTLEGVTYDRDLAEQLLEENKGEQRELVTMGGSA